MSYLNFLPMANSFGNVMYTQTYHREELPLEVPDVWDANIDPALRSIDNIVYQSYNGQPMERFLIEPEKPLFTVNHVEYPVGSFRPELKSPFQVMGTAPYPRGLPQPVLSPCQKTLSICSSDPSLSPGADPLREPYQAPQNFEECAVYGTPSSFAHDTPDLVWPSNTNSFGFLNTSGVINMSDVQGFPDFQDALYQTEPQELGFQVDEGYMELDPKLECANEVEAKTLEINTFSSRTHYRHPSDEGIGASVKDEGSPGCESVTNQAVKALDTDIDANADAEVDVEDEEVEAEEEEPEDIPAKDASDEDTDYSPTPRRQSNRRRSTRSTAASSPRSKRTKISKRSRSKASAGALECKTCSYTAKDAPSLHKHIAATHTRPYVCAFDFAGCPSTFASKNEWKRHVASQHLSLYYWRCELGACGSSGSTTTKAGPRPTNSTSNASTTGRASEFNRKDLFTQHLRRMHAPFAVKRQHKKSADWEERVRQLQKDCMRTRRQPPLKTMCPLSGCENVFEGLSAWDDRMEHVARHLEVLSSLNAAASVTAGGEGSGNKGVNGGLVGQHRQEMVVDQGNDEFTVVWALREGIIKLRIGGGGGSRYVLVGSEEQVVRVFEEGEEDAEGEDE